MAPCYSQKTDLSNELTFLQFDYSFLEPSGHNFEKKALKNSLFVVV